VFNNIKITFHYNVYMRTSGEKVRVSNEAECAQPVSNSHVRSLSGLYTVVCLREGKRGTCLGPLLLGVPSRYFAHKYSSFLVKNLLSAHIIFSESHHDSVLCLQRSPQEQLQSVSRLLCFQRAPQQQLKCVGTLLHKGAQQQLYFARTLPSKGPQ